MPDTTLTLSEQHQSLIQQLLDLGDYGDVSQVLTDALETLKEALVMGQIGERGKAEFEAGQGTMLRSPEAIAHLMASIRNRSKTLPNE